MSYRISTKWTNEKTHPDKNVFFRNKLFLKLQVGSSEERTMTMTHNANEMINLKGICPGITKKNYINYMSLLIKRTT